MEVIFEDETVFVSLQNMRHDMWYTFLFWSLDEHFPTTITLDGLRRLFKH